MNAQSSERKRAARFCLLPSQNFNRFRLTHCRCRRSTPFFPSYISFSVFVSFQRWRCCSVPSASSIFRVSFFFSSIWCTLLLLLAYAVYHNYVWFNFYYFQSSALVFVATRRNLSVSECSACTIHKTIFICFKCWMRAQLHSNTSLAMVPSSHRLRSYFFLCCFRWLSTVFCLVWRFTQTKSRYIAHSWTVIIMHANYALFSTTLPSIRSTSRPALNGQYWHFCCHHAHWPKQIARQTKTEFASWDHRVHKHLHRRPQEVQGQNYDTRITVPHNKCNSNEIEWKLRSH